MMKHASLPLLGWMAPLRHLGAKMPVGQKPPANREPSMNEITTIGLDLAKHVFQVHGGRTTAQARVVAAATSLGWDYSRGRRPAGAGFIAREPVRAAR